MLAIAAGVSNNGSYLWTIPTSLTPGNYQIRVTRNAAPTAVGFSGVITLNAPTTIFYVNGPTVYAGDVTTAPGNDANSGLDPADPKASIQSVLTSYTMSPGDEIYVDHGTYNLSSNIILTAADSGIIIDGIGALTILDRTNLATGSYVFDLQGTTNVTLENLAITGGDIGINASASAGSTGLTVSNSFLYGSQDYAISLSAGNAGTLITGNQIHDLLGIYGQDAGVYVNNDQVTVTNNTVYNDVAYGIHVAGVLGTPATTISGNTVYSNSIGIAASNATVSGNIAYGNWSPGISVSNTSTVTGNTTYNNLNTKTNSGPQIGIQLYGGTASGNISYGNAYGISFYGDATASNNLIYNNTTAGISGGNGSNILGNVLYGNLLGITANSNPSAADGGPVIENNLLYNNTTGGIYLAGGDHTPILNNTIYQTAGIALQLAFGSQTTNAVTVRNNTRSTWPPWPGCSTGSWRPTPRSSSSTTTWTCSPPPTTSSTWARAAARTAAASWPRAPRETSPGPRGAPPGRGWPSTWACRKPASPTRGPRAAWPPDPLDSQTGSGNHAPFGINDLSAERPEVTRSGDLATAWAGDEITRRG